MGNQAKYTSLHKFDVFKPISKTDITLQSKVVANTDPHNPPEDVHQLQVDVINVFEGRVELSSFSDEYQEKIKNYYRFSATKYLTNDPVMANRTKNTLDILWKIEINLTIGFLDINFQWYS